MRSTAKLSSRDNKGFLDKIQTRQRALSMLDAEPLVYEAYAGQGHLGKIVYDFPFGVATDLDEQAAISLSNIRPAWRVYQCDAVQALAHGLAADLPINFVDLDPYGSPWESYIAFWESERDRAPRVVIVVHDGMKRKVNMRGAWHTVLSDAVQVFGNDLGRQYLQVCRWKAKKHLELAGYELKGFFGYEQDSNNAHWVVLAEKQ